MKNKNEETCKGPHPATSDAGGLYAVAESGVGSYPSDKKGDAAALPLGSAGHGNGSDDRATSG